MPASCLRVRCLARPVIMDWELEVSFRKWWRVEMCVTHGDENAHRVPSLGWGSCSAMQLSVAAGARKRRCPWGHRGIARPLAR